MAISKQEKRRLTTETVEGACGGKQVRRVKMKTGRIRLTSLPLEGIDDIERGDGLPLGVLSVGDSVADDTLEEGLQDTTSLLVDHGGDTLDTTTAGKTTDSGLGDTLDVVTQDLAVTLSTALAETLSTLAAYSGRVSK